MNFKDYIKVHVLDVIALLIPVIASLALLSFFIGLVKFIAKAGDEKSHAEGRDLMIYGTLALFVMVSIWGILRLFNSELGLGTFVLPLLPTN